MGLDVYLQHNGQSDEQDSAIDPQHLFKRGYFRSSYNGSGFNSVMHRAGCPDLYVIFQAKQDVSRFTPDWQEAKTRANFALDQYRQHLASAAAGHYVDFFGIRDGDHKGPTSERDALQAFVVEAEREPRPFSAYSNKVGSFWHDGAVVKAVIPGMRHRFEGPGFYVIFEQPRREGERDSYETALLIVIETIDYVLASGDPGSFSLSWSA